MWAGSGRSRHESDFLRLKSVRGAGDPARSRLRPDESRRLGARCHHVHFYHRQDALRRDQGLPFRHVFGMSKYRPLIDLLIGVDSQWCFYHRRSGREGHFQQNKTRWGSRGRILAYLEPKWLKQLLQDHQTQHIHIDYLSTS